MSVSRKVERELIRAHYLKLITDYLISLDEDVRQVKSNEIALPVVGCEDNEDALVITFKVPTGANKGTEPYDLYAEAENYAFKLAEDKRKAEEKEKAKAKKTARDEEVRKRKAEINAKGK